MMYYSSAHNSVNHDPDPKYIIDHYQQFIATKIRVVGPVQHVDLANNTLVIQISSTRVNIILANTTENLTTIQPGDTLEAYGPLIDATHIRAENSSCMNTGKIP